MGYLFRFFTISSKSSLLESLQEFFANNYSNYLSTNSQYNSKSLGVSEFKATYSLFKKTKSSSFVNFSVYLLISLNFLENSVNLFKTSVSKNHSLLRTFQIYSINLLASRSSKLSVRRFYQSNILVSDVIKKVSVGSFNKSGGLKMTSSNNLYADSLRSKYSGLKSFVLTSSKALNTQVFYTRWVESSYKSFFYSTGRSELDTTAQYSNSNVVKFIDPLTLGSYNMQFLRKSKIFNKGRYSRNRQFYRTGVYWCLYLSLILFTGLYY